MPVGVIGLTRSAAKELGPFGIRVNAVLPGFIETPMIDTVPEEVKMKLFKNIPLNHRPGKPEEVANVCNFLASEKSSYVTGAAIEVTGVITTMFDLFLGDSPLFLILVCMFSIKLGILNGLRLPHECCSRMKELKLNNKLC